MTRCLLVLLVCASIESLAQDFSRYVDDSTIPDVDLPDNLKLNFTWNMKGKIQASLNEGINLLAEGKPGPAITPLSEAIALDSTLWMVYYYRGVAYKQVRRSKDAEADLLRSRKLKADQPETCIELGEIYEGRREMQKASELYKEATRINPKVVQAYYKLGNLELSNRAPANAKKYYEKCHEVDPHFAPAYVTQGILEIRSGRRNMTTISLLSDAIKADSTYSISYVWRGLMYIHNKEYDKALADWNKFILRQPNNLFIRSLRAFLYVELERYDDAFADLRKALVANDIPETSFTGSLTILDQQIELQSLARYVVRHAYGMRDEALAHVKKGFCLTLAGRSREAIKSIESAEKIEPSATVYYLHAFAFDSKYDSAAVSYYTKALELDNDIFEAHKKRSYWRWDRKDWKGAIIDLDEMVRLNPSVNATYRYRGYARAQMGDCKNAVLDYNRFIAMDSSDNGVFRDRASCRDMIGDKKGAISDYIIALNHAPYSSSLYELIIDKYLQIQDTTMALKVADDYLARSPDALTNKLKKAEIFIAQKKWEQAKSLVDFALGKFYRGHYYYDNEVFSRTHILAGRVATGQQQYRQAFEHFDLAIRKRPPNYEAIYFRGKAYLAAGKRYEAIKAFTELKTLGYGDSAEVLEGLKKK